MKIGIDILGGDFAPEANIAGSILARKELPSDVRIVLYGDQEVIVRELEKRGEDVQHYDIVHAPDVITMSDHPTRAIPSKPNSSMAIGFDQLANKDIDVFASTGNTGAMLVGSMFKIGAIPEIQRPCIMSVLPTEDGKNSILLDVGANADCKPEILVQFAIIGSTYANTVQGIDKPKVGLLNIGEEDTKGNMLTIATHKLLAETEGIHFIGNIEARDLFSGTADVVVCDGFTGNNVLKQAEGMYTIMRKRGIKDAYFDRFNYENYGGTPILGVKGNVIIGHGISNDVAVKNMLKHAFEVTKSELAIHINKAFNQ